MHELQRKRQQIGNFGVLQPGSGHMINIEDLNGNDNDNSNNHIEMCNLRFL